MVRDPPLPRIRGDETRSAFGRSLEKNLAKGDAISPAAEGGLGHPGMPVRVSREQRVAVVTLDRAQQLNALSTQLMNELVGALEELDADPEIRCIVLAGNERAFAAGADVGEMADASAMEMLAQRRVGQWDAIRTLRTPLVAAVSGWCLGGGCELAM